MSKLNPIVILQIQDLIETLNDTSENMREIRRAVYYAIDLLHEEIDHIDESLKDAIEED